MPTTADGLARPRVLPQSPALTTQDLFREYAPFVWRVLRRLGVAESDIEDVCQEVFMAVHKQLPAFEGRSKPRTWIYAIARRLALILRPHTAPEPAPPVEPVPVPVPQREAGVRWSPARWPILASAGGGFGEAPETVMLLGVAARVEADFAADSHAGQLAGELELRWSPPVEVTRQGLTVAVDSFGTQLASCQGSPTRRLQFELCAGLWLRLLHARPSGASAGQVTATKGQWLPLVGLSMRLSGRVRLDGPLSLFASIESGMPFGHGRLRLRPTDGDDASPQTATGSPFFNTLPAEPTLPEPITVFEPPRFTGSLKLGVMVEL